MLTKHDFTLGKITVYTNAHSGELLKSVVLLSLLLREATAPLTLQKATAPRNSSKGPPQLGPQGLPPHSTNLWPPLRSTVQGATSRHLIVKGAAAT